MRLLVLFFLLLLPSASYASNAGIVRGLWYSDETFFAGEDVRIYVAVRNNTGADLSGTVEFFVNGKKIERKNIDALDGRIVESWADWRPSFGTSTITATLSRTELTSTASGTRAVQVVSALAEDTIFIDYDTDADGVANSEDDDDDGDGVADQAEIDNGTDPLNYDEPARPGEAEEETDATEENQGNSDENQTTSNEPEGLERFLVPSRADTILTEVTEVINDTKKKIDDYRTKRETEKKIESGELIVPVNDDGFGAIERSQKTEDNKPVPEKPEGFFGDLLTFFGNIFSAVWTGLLFLISWLLGYPILMQVLLLILILLLVYKLAKRLGGRPQ